MLFLFDDCFLSIDDVDALGQVAGHLLTCQREDAFCSLVLVEGHRVDARRNDAALLEDLNVVALCFGSVAAEEGAVFIVSDQVVLVL